MGQGHQVSRVGQLIQAHQLMFGRLFYVKYEIADEFIEAIVTVYFHDVSEDGHPAQLYHGLGLELGFFADSCAKTASKY